ncbi:SDR family oxidoreductase [Rhizobium sp. VS19-DR104.2]|uniref:SDR family oxidoreductase n=1 Tax=unclassified Rhizobium TaxID=2613769 RepID=UPI001C5B9444|nr:MULTISPECIES: SDR family oxidoreductase [unclassified Rhizobium]MBZ5760099.1 SDR family oxidoreductase [Rhizobium sp. VS19-DR96]MBZ5766420.1 SDR family oxidoreductase [Rhizobium sp. VS19-DR129.2]MBZ5774237.1 SDR family oxidoreductase [Rhizobium sp. VS19-DRK62.2]MBZ5785309.1 SDR family oxidoreductase [Rhizobium sp. VS19-DR121]MBZ5802908.1 SDR family oxidoreductase [Rhizobium sp. VS19-DR181]
MTKSALIIGATGIVGNNLARHLIDKGFEVAGLARNPASDIAGLRPVAANLLDPESLASAVRDLKPSHVFFSTWSRQATELENIRVNGAMVKNLLDALRPHKSVEHVALVTGLKHYLGPFEAYGKGVLPATPFREEQGRLEVDNFYYAQEDEVFAAAKTDGFSWSVDRPHTIIGYALGNAMNMGVTLAVYASICKATGRPFIFPGSPMQWNGLSDMTDARLLARHLEWASTTDAARNKDFNVVNGDVFRWSWMWQRIAAWFDIEPQPLPSEMTTLESQLADAGPIWADIAAKNGLAEHDINKLASAWHTDADLGRPIEVMTDMSKSRKLGFLDYQATDDSFTDLFTRLREARIIP